MTMLLVIGAEARADELQDRVLAAVRASRSDAYGFRRTMVIDRTGAARKVLVEQYDPRRPVAERWSLVSVDGQAPSAKQADQSRKAKRGPVPSYAELATWIGAPATRLEPTPGTAPGHVTYRFARLPAGTLKIGSHDASADTQAEAVINTEGRVPFVERVRFTSAKGFRMMMVASVRSMVITNRYAPLPNGGVVPAESASVIAGSLLGKSGQMRTAVTYGAFRPAN